MVTGKTKRGVEVSRLAGVRRNEEKRTWVLVANRGGARIFKRQSPGGHLSLLRELGHPQGKAQPSELTRDRPGRTADSRGAGRHALESRTEPGEREDNKFAASLAERLDEGLRQNLFDRFLVVAEPKFLGTILSHLGREAGSRAMKPLEKDYSYLTPVELALRLEEELAEE